MSKYKEWQSKHGEVISSFLKYLNSITDGYILKGGTALKSCYNLDRFSEDIDLDGRDTDIGKIVDDYCKKKDYSYRIAKDTDTVKRYMVNYGNTGKPLKIEISFRKKNIAPDEITKINGIAVYRIDNLCAMKANAYVGRDKIRDLYDLTFICNKYWEEISSSTKAFVRNAVEFKGIEQFDYIIREHEDILIDKNKLASDFLEMYDKLGLLYSEDEREILSESYYEKNNHTDNNKSTEREGPSRSSLKDISERIKKTRNENNFEPPKEKHKSKEQER